MSDSSPLPPSSSLARDHNRRAWDQRARNQQRFTRPASDDDVANPLTKVDVAWFGDLRGKRLLCLAAGGGRQSVLYAAAGAIVTVVDVSPEQLAIDREVARERGLDITAVEASMDDLSAFAPATFDAVMQPVSSCYLPDVTAIYREVARVMVSGGIYVSQHKQPTSLQAQVQPSPSGYLISQPYYRTGPLPNVKGSLHREDGTLEFLHRWEELLGGLCRAGFVIEDLSEPLHAKPDAEIGTFGHRSQFIAPYVRIKARRVGATAEGGTARVWVP